MGKTAGEKRIGPPIGSQGDARPRKGSIERPEAMLHCMETGSPRPAPPK
jgi:hypothetical protein